MNFTHLHVHTEYSLLDGSNKIQEYVNRVKELGMDSAAITDHGVMYGVIDFYRAARAAGINPVLGCEVYVAPGSRFDREIGSGDDRYYHLVLLAENNQGYANLMKIVSKSFVEGFYYKPRVDLQLLEKYHEGLIALSACLAGEVARYLTRGMYEDAKAAALRYQDIFGKGNFFLELQDHGIPEQQNVNQQLLKMHRETGIELVATNDVHYTLAEDAQPHDVLLCLQTGKKLSDENRMRYDGGQYYVKSPEEMERLFPYATEALENTHKIAQRCHVEIEFGVTKLPKFDVPQGYTSWEYLNELCFKGLEERYQPVTEELKERLNYELSTIKNMGYVDYFLIVWDFIRYARDHDIMVGPGRGSAAGSLVAYTLGITQLDPIRYDLLFERFLNPERVSMPDIDVDFCFERRQEVIDYVRRKYGDDCVVQIVTFGTLAARGVIRDVGRVMDLPYAQVDTIAKMIPQELNITIDKALKMNPELKKTYEEQPEIHDLIDTARRLEGLPRHTSMHAAGVVISQKDVSEYVPLSRAQDGSIVTQFTMTTLEELGLLKMDFLGLRTLTVIQNAVHLIEQDTGVHLDMQKIDYNDKKVLDSLGTGRSDGVFQLESAGMKNFMKELKPQSLEDVIAGISLYRPGPMDFIPQYIRGKNHPDTIQYDCPQLEPILKPTYGCIVYQEQVMQIVRSLAGYTLGRSDLVRRAMSKKKASVMEKERQNFVYGNEQEGVPGCIANGIDEQTANKIYDDMTDFAKYAFNKSHAAAYAVVSYQTAFLKYYYPVEFMAALLQGASTNKDKTALYLGEARRMGIQVLSPDVNESVYEYSAVGDVVRFGLGAIRNVGKAAVDAIVKERENDHGKYVNFPDFIRRVPMEALNRRLVESLIKAGAFDSIDPNRRALFTIHEAAINSVVGLKRKQAEGQFDLFSDLEDAGEDDAGMGDAMVKWDKKTKLNFEREMLGLYVSDHPLSGMQSILVSLREMSIAHLIDRAANMPDGQQVTVAGLITNVDRRMSKKGNPWAIVTIEDLESSIQCMFFGKVYETAAPELAVDTVVQIRGQVEKRDETVSMRATEFNVPTLEAQDEKPVTIMLPPIALDQSHVQQLGQILSNHPGPCEVKLALMDDKGNAKVLTFGDRFRVRRDTSLFAEIKILFGPSSLPLG